MAFYQILGCKTVYKNVQIDPQTNEIWATELNVPLSVSDGVNESVNDTLVGAELLKSKSV